MIRVGLTGNVAAGKSTVAKTWSAAGIPVLDADALARDVVAPGSPGLAEVVESFGAELLTPRGTLDRDRMRERAFRDPAARNRLEAILHPRIAELRRRWIEARESEGAPLVVNEIPLLYETGIEREFDVIVVVDAPASVRLRRLVEGRGIPLEEADRILASQGDPREKLRRADFVLRNEGSIEHLEGEARSLLTRLLGDPGMGPEAAQPTPGKGGRET